MVGITFTFDGVLDFNAVINYSNTYRTHCIPDILSVSMYVEHICHFYEYYFILMRSKQLYLYEETEALLKVM